MVALDPKIVAAIIGGVVGSIVSLISSYLITKLKIKQEVMIWNSEFSVNYSKLLFSDPKAARQLARQFAVGLIIVRDNDGATKSKHFIPYQCKVSIGRSEDNDICLEPNTVSRDHGVLFFRGKKVMYQEFSPMNKSVLNGKTIDKICELNSGDVLEIGGVKVEYEALT